MIYLDSFISNYFIDHLLCDRLPLSTEGNTTASVLISHNPELTPFLEILLLWNSDCLQRVLYLSSEAMGMDEDWGKKGGEGTRGGEQGREAINPKGAVLS